MEINFQNGCLFVRGKDTVVVLDPVNYAKHLVSIKGKEGLVLFTQRTSEEVLLSLRNEERAVLPIGGPGQYEKKGVEVDCFNVGGENMFLVRMEELSVLIVGVNQKVISDKLLGKVQGADILVLGFKNDKQDCGVGVALAKKIGPTLLVPFEVEDGGLKGYLDEVDLETQTPVVRLKIKKEELPENEQVVLLEGANVSR